MNGVDIWFFVSTAILLGAGFILGFFMGIITATGMDRQEEDDESSN